MNFILKKYIPERLYLKHRYKKNFKRKLNFNNPKTFNEKLQWLKLHDRKDIYTTMVDKYEVKKYVAKIIGEEYIIPTYGIYDSFNDINFDKLPNQFVIKCTHDSGGLVVCRNKNDFNFKESKNKIEQCLKNNFYYNSREWPYKNVKPRVIVEKYMQDANSKELKDYKFYCFNGIPKYLYVSEGLENHETAKIEFFDMDFHTAPFQRTDYKTFDIKPDIPINFEKMKELSLILSKNIPFVRVDFYEINKKVYFGELTFTPCGGFMPFSPDEWDYKLGDMLDISMVKINEK